MKDFHNVLTNYDRSKLKEIECKKATFIYISYDVMLKYICAKKKSYNILKKYKYIKKRIKMILNIYKIYSF
jgi:hypothetical protein